MPLVITPSTPTITINGTVDLSVDVPVETVVTRWSWSGPVNLSMPYKLLSGAVDTRKVRITGVGAGDAQISCQIGTCATSAAAATVHVIP